MVISFACRQSFYKKGTEVGPTMAKLYTALTQIQLGEVEDKYGWTIEV